MKLQPSRELLKAIRLLSGKAPKSRLHLHEDFLTPLLTIFSRCLNAIFEKSNPPYSVTSLLKKYPNLDRGSTKW